MTNPSILINQVFLYLLILSVLIMMIIEFKKNKDLKKYNQRFKEYASSKKRKRNIKYNLQKDNKDLLDYYMSHNDESLNNLELELIIEKESLEPFLANIIGTLAIPVFALLTALLSVLAPGLDPEKLVEGFNLILGSIGLIVIIYSIEHLSRSRKILKISKHLAVVSHVKKIKSDKNHKP